MRPLVIYSVCYFVFFSLRFPSSYFTKVTKHHVIPNISEELPVFAVGYLALWVMIYNYRFPWSGSFRENLAEVILRSVETPVTKHVSSRNCCVLNFPLLFTPSIFITLRVKNCSKNTHYRIIKKKYFIKLKYIPT